MKHGGDLLTYQHYYPEELIDFSSNINPLGLPVGLKEKLFNSFENLKVYPDIKYRKLKKAIGAYLGCSEGNVLVGNGAVEIINNFIIGAKRVVIMTPSFSEYENRAIVHGKPVIKIPYIQDEYNFLVNLESLDNFLKKDDILILGNPNNPTGLRIEQEMLEEVYDLVVRRKAYLLLDEAFYEFCPPDYDSIDLFKDYDYEKVGIIRAATKFFSLPGIRLGYACSSIEKSEMIQKIELPWSVNAMADAAGQFIFENSDFIKESRSYIEKEREYLLDKLMDIEGIRPYKSHTNYILIKLIAWDGDYIFDYFLRRGILLRTCSSFLELADDYIRIAIKDRENNQRLIKVFEELVSLN